MVEETIGARLKRLREAAGLNQYRLGQISGIDPSYIGRIEAAVIRRPGLSVLKKLARALNLRLFDLIGEEDGGVPPATPAEAGNDRFTELKRVLGKFGARELEFIGDVVPVPLRGYVRAGTPGVVEQEEGEALFISRNLIKTLTGRLTGVYALRISGESLSGDGIHSGDAILVLPAADFDIDGKLYIIRDPRNGESVVRHLYHRAGRIRIEASNPDYEPLLLDEVEVIGRVIYIQPQGKVA